MDMWVTFAAAALQTALQRTDTELDDDVELAAEAADKMVRELDKRAQLPVVPSLSESEEKP